MPSARTRLLPRADTLVSGILVGGVVDHVVVGGPLSMSWAKKDGWQTAVSRTNVGFWHRPAGV